MTEQHDPVLDACLDEILGGQTPPDLTPRIMQAWAMLPPALPAEPCAEPPVQNPVTIKAAGKKPASPTSAALRVSRLWVSVAVAASIVAVGLGIGYALLPVAAPETNPSGVARNPGTATRPSGDHGLPAAPRPDEIVDAPPSPPRRNDAPEVITPDFVTEPPFETGGQPPLELAIDNAPRVDALDDAQVVTAIDGAIRAAWQEHKISPAARGSDEEFAARLFQQLLGRGPTAVELQSFVASRAKNKRVQLVDDLLSREENLVEFARHWSGIWADALVGRGATGAEFQASRDGLEQYLRRAIQQARPLDQVATELLTATGSGAVGSPQYNGAANFLLTHYDGKATRATAQVARAFLGKRIQCAQCHDHPNDAALAQNRFWELNTFLRQLKVERVGAEGADAAVVLVSRDFHGDGGGDGSDAEVFYETPSGEVKVAYPVLPGLTGVPHSGRVNEFDRRARLARYIAGSPDFRRAVVNRVWANIFGYGFTSPVDDLGPHNRPSHPQLLNDLADQFAAHDYDLRALIRWMVLSEPFQLGSGQGVDLADAPEAGRDRWFSRSYPQPAAKPVPRESLQALAKATADGKHALGVGTTANVKPSFPTPGGIAPDKAMAPLTIASQDFGATGNFVPEVIERILGSDMSSGQKLDHLFLATVQRLPTSRERGLVAEITGDIAAADRAALLQVWWTLDRSSE